ncbi:MAG: ATP synthase subunit I [Candidatus Aminicenantes bacterium]|nr:ATP synthase subunit I [Candidatus Aminicenantes bacterium]
MTYEEKALRRIPLEMIVIAAVIGLLAVLVFNPLTGLFILAGGLFSAVSFIWLKTALNQILGTDRRKAVRSGLVFYLIRLVLLLAVFSIIILFFPRMILAFAAGFSSLIMAFLIEAAMAFSQKKQWKV